MGRVKNAKKIREYYAIILNETTRLFGYCEQDSQFFTNRKQIKENILLARLILMKLSKMQLLFSISMKTKGFVIFLRTDITCSVQADREAITDAFINLMTMQCKYSGEIKNIIVQNRKNDRYAYIEVEIMYWNSDKKPEIILIILPCHRMNLANRVKGSDWD